jgi:hypothetical protein
MKSKQPTPKGFVENLWYEHVTHIMRSDPKRFFLFSPATKYCLSVYLDLKEKHQQLERAA